MYVCMYVCMHACMHACMHVYIYIYVYIEIIIRSPKKVGLLGYRYSIFGSSSIREFLKLPGLPSLSAGLGYPCQRARWAR